LGGKDFKKQDYFGQGDSFILIVLPPIVVPLLFWLRV